MRCKVKLSIMVLALYMIPFLSYSQFNGEVNIGYGGNYTTLSEFADSLNSLGMSGNTTVNIISDFVEVNPIIINQWAEIGGTGYYLTIKPYGDNRTVQGSFDSSAVMILNGADRVIIDGEMNYGERNLTFINNAITGMNATIWVRSLGVNQGCNQITIKNLNIWGADSNAISFGVFAAGTAISPSIGGPDNDNLLIFNNHIQRAYYGIYVKSDYGLNDSLRIIWNEIGSEIVTNSILCYGIFIERSPSAIISKNHIYNMRRNPPEAIAGIYISLFSTNSLVENNVINGLSQKYNNGKGAYGININSENVTNCNDSIRIINNSITDISTINYNQTSTTDNPFGIRITGGKKHKIWFNSVNLYGTQGEIGNSASLTACILVTGYPNYPDEYNLDIRNNVFSNSLEGKVGTNSHAICVFGSSETFSHIDNNDYYVSGENAVLGFLGNYYDLIYHKTTLNQWQEATIQDSLSFDENPIFTNETNLMPILGSPLLLNGELIEDVNYDILGNIRYSSPTIGAYEYQFNDNMYYSSSNVIHPSFEPIIKGLSNDAVKILQINIKIDGINNPVNLTNLSFNSNGTTNPNDITQAKLYYTGSNNFLTTENQFGETIFNISEPFMFIDNQELKPNNNYFWLIYTISDNPIEFNVIDAECISFTINDSVYIPEISAPVGSRMIRDYMHGVYTIGESGFYSNLNNAFADISLLGLQGDLELQIVSDIIEPESVVINEWQEFNGQNYYITIKPTGSSHTIEGNFPGEAVLKFNGADRVIINGEFNDGERNLTIINNSSEQHVAGIWIASLSTSDPCENITIRNTIIYGSTAGTEVSENYGIFIGGNSFYVAQNYGKSNNIVIENNHIKRAYYGILAIGLNTDLITNLQIIGNEIGSDYQFESIFMKGISIKNSNSPLISHNFIHDINLSYNSESVVGIEISTNCSNAKIEGNRIHGLIRTSGGSGAYGINIQSSTGNNNIRIFNNAITQILTANNSSSSTSDNPFGIRITGGTNIKIWHNSINLYGTQGYSGTSGSLTACLIVTSTSVNGLDIRNNVFSNSITGLAETSSYAICIRGSSSSFSYIDNNDYYVEGDYGVLGHLGSRINLSNQKTTLLQWQQATLKDFSSIAENPLFTENTDLMPLDLSPLIIAGIPIEDVVTDILGNPRSNNPTIGAYEIFEILQSPVLISPENNYYNLNTFPVLNWGEVDNAEFYNIQLSLLTDFDDLIYNENVFVTNFNIINALNFSTTYYWRVTACGTGTVDNWSEVWSFTTQPYIPWEYTITNNSSSIIVPASINPMLGDRPFAAGDAIGLFYQNDNNEWTCAGYGIWNGTTNLGITVWGDNDTTEIKDGFAVGETYTFKVWDAVLEQEWNAIATYQEGPDNYQINGFSMLASLIVNIPVEQNISLNSGWNMISSYILPENDTIPNVFSDLVSNLKIVKNGAGEMYDPAFNINTIGNWNYEDGYLVNMLNSNELTITGTKLLPEETPMNLNNGWNLSAYLRDNEMSPTTALASISSSLVLAKNNVGGIYSPAFGINTLGNMQAGQGYYFYMNAPAMLTYPANSAQKSFAGDEITPLAKYNIPTIGNTGKNATLLISIENNEGNEIGVYNMNNELIGSGAVHNGIAAITIWGDDETTQNVDGAKESEYLKVKLYNTNDNTNKEISLSQIKEITSKTEQSELIYRTNAIFVAKASANDESGFAMSIKNIPNPVESNVVFEFSLTDDANAKIQIYTSTGELVASIGSGNYSAGLHRINFDASNLASGMYNIVLSSGSKKVSTFMVVDK